MILVDMKSQYVFNKSVVLIIGLLFVLCFSSCSTAEKVGANLEKEYIEKGFTQRAIRRNGDFLKQFSYPNSVYVIKKKINLKGQSIAIAPGSVLLFKGGSIKMEVL